MKNRTRVVAVGMAVAALTAAVALPAASSSARAARKTFTGGTVSFAKPANDAGKAHGKVAIAVALRWRHAADLAAFNQAVSDPSSPTYGQYLSASQFRQRYAPTSARVATVRAFLRRNGFRIDRVSKSRMLVDATGSVREADKAFHTSLREYNVGKHTLRAASRPASLPAHVGRGVIGAVGLDQTVLHHLSRTAPPPPAFVVGKPCSKYWGQVFSGGDVPPAFGEQQPFAPCGYTPHQLQSAYGLDGAIGGGNDGSGEQVAIIDAFAAPTIVADVNEYSSRHGLPPATITQTILHGCQIACGTTAQQGWYGEETLDLDAVHTMAPGAAIHYYGAADPSGKALLDALGMVADDNDSSIVTNSYGSLDESGPQVLITSQEQIHAQARAEGISVLFSSGDDGDEFHTAGFRTADYPASSPQVTAVGGTSLGVGPTNQRTFEIGWGTKKSTLVGKKHLRWDPKPPGDFLYGSGGGTSRIFAEPDYQQGVVPEELATEFGGNDRVVPDISLDGDPTTGMLVGETQTFPNGDRKYGEYRIGGTSLSSPLFAGYLADANQAHGARLGFVNPALYALAGDSSAIRDTLPARRQMAATRLDYNNGVNGRNGVTLSLRSMGLDSSLRTTPGYDNVTGLGSPADNAGLINALTP